MRNTLPNGVRPVHRVGRLFLPAVLSLLVPVVSRADAPPANDLSWWLRLRSTGYAFQTVDPSNSGTDRFGAYQGVEGGVRGLARGRVTLRVSGRLADDFRLSERITDRARLYSAYIDAALPGHTRARLGRQFVQQEATGLTLDGLFLGVRKGRRWEGSIWGGVRAPLITEYRDRTGDFGEDPAVGIRLVARGGRGARIALGYAYRERDGIVSSRPIGAGVWWTPLKSVRATGRAAYDLAREVWDRAEFRVRWKPVRTGIALAAQYVDRSNRADAASWFSRFTGVERSRLGRVTARYDRKDRFGGEIEYSGAFVGERTSTRLGGALIVPGGRVGYSARLGDAGEESSVYGDFSIDPLRWLRLAGGARISTYALFEDAPSDEERDLTTAWARVRLVPARGSALTVEAQRVENPAYSEDYRFLVGLDLTAGGGDLPSGWNRRGGVAR